MCYVDYKCLFYTFLLVSTILIITLKTKQFPLLHNFIKRHKNNKFLETNCRKIYVYVHTHVICLSKTIFLFLRFLP